MGDLQPSRVTSRVTSSQKWRTSSPPATFVRNRVLYVKFMPNIQRAQRALSPCSQKITSRITSKGHIHANFRGRVTSERSHPQTNPDKIQSLPASERKSHTVHGGTLGGDGWMGEAACCYGSLLLGGSGTRCLAEHASLSYGEVCAL